MVGAENIEVKGAEQFTVVKPFDDVKVEEWAAKCGGRRNLREVTVTIDSEQFVYLVKKPTRSVIQAVATYKEKNDITGIEKVMMGCVLEGDKEAYEHDASIAKELLLAIGELARQGQREVKKL